jgi:hypothetical protein
MAGIMRRGAAEAKALLNGRCLLHGGPSTGVPRGNKDALKHGHYTGAAIAHRREIAILLHKMNALARDFD